MFTRLSIIFNICCVHILNYRLVGSIIYCFTSIKYYILMKIKKKKYQFLLYIEDNLEHHDDIITQYSCCTLYDIVIEPKPDIY